MQLTKGAIGNLINRYKAVLKKCHLMNTFGSLAVAGMLVMGGAGVAVAADPDWGTANKPNTTGYTWTGEETVTHTGDVHIQTGNVRAFQAYQTDTKKKGAISLGSGSSTIVINSSIKKGSSYGVLVFDNSSAHSNQLKLNLTGDTISISAESKDGYAGALHVSSDVTVSDKNENNTVNIVSKNGTTIYAKGTTGASAIELMSGGILNISGPLTAKAELDDGSKGDVIYARGGATLNIGANGETVKLDGNINFGYEKTTSGTGVDAFVNVTLTGADSYWNGNTITSWSPNKPSDEKLEVTSLKVALNKGATWTPTVVENSQSKDQQYTALNKLTLDGGIVDVNQGVAITIENIDGKGAITNAGSVTIEKGTIEGPITFEKGDATADNMVTVGEDGITTLTGGVAGSGTIDQLAIAEDGKTTITNAKLSGHEGRALWNNGTLTVNGGSFEGNKANVAGAIYNAADADLTVDGVTFANNSSVNNVAGAINNRDGQVTIKKSTFTGNDSGTKAGGAIANTAGSTEEGKLGTITITGSTFEGNKAGNGGAVWNGSDGKVKIADSTFKGNTAVAKGGLGQGGAITNADQMTITGGSFANNTANYSGGAIYNDANAAGSQTSLTIDGTTFTGNSVTADFKTTNNDNIAGGAIFNDTGAKLDVKNATFTDNTSSLKGGAIFNRDGEVTIENSTFKGNSVPTSAGGAVLNESGDTSKTGTITITGSTFEGNKAGNGGAVWNGFNGKVDITASTFKSNTALVGIGQGGAITNANQMSITGSTFEGNQAGKIGGAIFNAASGELDFKGTNTFTNNTAAGKANDIYNAGTITVAGGTTTLNSGLILAGSGTVKVIGGTLDMASGSTLNMGDDGTLTIDGGTFVADAGLLIKNDPTTGSYAANDANKVTQDNIVGTEGNLNLRWFDGDYTLDEYKSAKGALFSVGSEEAELTLLNARLDVEDGNTLVTGATLDNGTATLATGAKVVENDSTNVAGGTDAPHTPENYVSVVDKEDADKLLSVSAIATNGNSITAKGLEVDGLPGGSKEVTLQVTSLDGNNSTLTLVGDSKADTGVIDKDGKALATKAEVAENNTLNMGLTGNTQDQGLTLTEATVKGTLNANGGVAGTTSEYAINALTMQTNSQVNVLNSTMQIGQFTAAGGTMFVDPAYVKIDSVTSPTFGTKLLVGTGSTVNIGGMSEADMRQAMEKAGMSVGPNFTVGANQSVLVLGQGITLGATGQIVVDANVTSSGTIPGTSAVATAHFGDGSLLVVNGNAINGATAAINLSGATTKTLNVENGAKLFITDAVAGQTYTVITGANTDTAFNGGAYADAGTTGWKGDNLLTSSDMLTLTSTDGTVFTAKSEDAHTVFPKLSHELATAVNTLYGQKLNDVDADAMGVRFLSRATDNRFLGADKDAAASTIESAARIAFAGAVPQMTKMASDAGSNAVVNRLGFANPADGAQAMNAEGKIVDRNTTGFALWIAPLWQSQHGWGMEADNLDYGFNGNLGGVSLGADYTFENAIRAGITFNIGGGYAESSGGDLNSTENRMSFWGLGAYAGWNYENFGLMADVSYTSTWNDLKQDMDSRMGMGDLEADVQASAISAGLRAEYKLETSVLDVIPHIGVRYMSLNTWGFDAESNGGTVLEGDGFHQDIWTFPVGVTFTKDFTLDSGWSFKPSIDFSVIPAAGDIKAKQDVAFTGLPGSYEVETQMMDYLTWQGGVGLEMGNDTMSFGVNYTLQAGQHTTGHGVFGSFRYEF